MFMGDTGCDGPEGDDREISMKRRRRLDGNDRESFTGGCRP